MLNLRPLGFVTSLCIVAHVARAEAPLEYAVVPINIDSGIVEPVGADESDGELVVTYQTVVQVPGAAWLRLQFESTSLGSSLLRITSITDGADQLLTAQTLARWRNTSAYFNGDAVLVELLAHADATPGQVCIHSAQAGMPRIQREGVDRSLCPLPDDRAPYFDLRLGRVRPTGCTAFLINNTGTGNELLTAGHCTRDDVTGEFMLFDMQIVEFAVPPSASDGTWIFSDPEWQYLVDLNSIQSHYTGDGSAPGDDYCYFGVFPNEQTGLRPLQAIGSTFDIQSAPPSSGSTVRVSGYGVDSGTLNLTLQTDTGSYSGLSGTSVSYSQLAAAQGVSGAPIVLELGSSAIGIHTESNCIGQGKGTALQHSGLQAMLADPSGVCIPRPSIASLTASPASVAHGQTFTLTANGVSHPQGASAIAQVEFFRDTNGNCTLDPGTDQYLGVDASSAGGWSWSGPAQASWGTGSVQVSAVAYDTQGRESNAACATLQVTSGGSSSCYITLSNMSDAFYNNGAALFYSVGVADVPTSWIITNVQYRMYTLCSCLQDLVVWIDNASYAPGAEYFVWDRYGSQCKDGGQDDDSETDADVDFSQWRSTNAFNGLPVAGAWTFTFFPVGSSIAGSVDFCQLRIYFDAPGTPDVTVTHIETELSQPIAGQPDRLYATIANLGTGEVSDHNGALHIDYFINGVDVGSDTHDLLTPGQTRDESVAYTFPAPGEYTFQACVTPDDCLGDLITSNNCLSVQVSVATPPPLPPHSPDPIDGATLVSINQLLSWSPDPRALMYLVHFGPDTPPRPRSLQSEAVFDPSWTELGQLAPGTVYYWQVIALTETLEVPGPIWSFTTIPLPDPAATPLPAHDEWGVARDVTLSWSNPGDATAYDVYFSEDPTIDASDYKGRQSTMTFDPGSLDCASVYYWRIDTINTYGVTQGTAWQFRTWPDQRISETPFRPEYGWTDFGVAIAADESSALAAGPPMVCSFRRDNDEWVKTGEWPAPVPPSWPNRPALAMSGNRAAATYGVSTVFTYRHDGTEWIPAETMTMPSEAYSCAINGHLMAVSLSDKVRIYRDIGTGWSFECEVPSVLTCMINYLTNFQELKCPWVAIDGERFAVRNNGAVDIYELHSGDWVLATSVSVPTPAHEYGCNEGPIILDGNELVVGAIEFDPLDLSGRVFVFNRFGHNWNLVQTISDPAGSLQRGWFGSNVAKSNGVLFVRSGFAVMPAPGTINAFEMIGGAYTYVGGVDGQTRQFALAMDIGGGGVLVGNPEIFSVDVLHQWWDCDSDGAVDACEISEGMDTDVNGNFVPDSCECIADITGDGFTNAADFTIIAGNFGATVAPNTGGDLNGDGLVNAADFTILAGDFGCGL